MQEATTLLISRMHQVVDYMFAKEGDFVVHLYRRKSDGQHGVWAERPYCTLPDSGFTLVKTLGKYSCYQHRNNQGNVFADVIKQIDEHFVSIEQLAWVDRKSYYICK